MSTSGPDGGLKDPFEIEIDEALRNFGAVSAAEPGEEAVQEEFDADGGPPADAARSNGSGSDPDVIHIDLTQRPPPLPMSGLSLEEIVSMLPGSTYAVSGSGVPIRTSPRSEPRQQSPTAKTSPRPAAAEAAAAAAAADTDSGQGAAESARDEDAGDEGLDVEGAAAMPGLGAGSGLGSPQVALTFIPGLGLVPVMIHDMLEEDEEEEEGEEDGDGDVVFDQGSDSVELGGGADAGGNGATAEATEEEEGADAAAEATADGFSSGAARPQTADAMPRLAAEEQAAATPTAADAATGAGASPSFAEPQPTAATGSGPDTSAAPAAAGPSAQLKDIIQQAIQGLEFQGDSAEGVPVAVDDDDDNGDGDGEDECDGGLEGSSASGDVGFDSPERHAVFERLFSVGSHPVTAAGSGAGETAAAAAAAEAEVEEALDPSARQLLARFERAEDGTPLPAAAASQPAVAAAAAAERGGAADEEVDEYDDDLVDGDDDEHASGGSLDEVDDSGSGGGDEPDSMLGGLAHARLGGFAADGLHKPAAKTAGGYTATTIEASGIRSLGSTLRGPPITTAAGAGAAAKGVTGGDGDAHFSVRVSESSGGAGPQLPRPRYLSHNLSRSYDASYGTPDDDDVSPYAGRAAAAGRGVAAWGPAEEGPELDLSASDAAANPASSSDGGSSSRTATLGGATRGGDSGVSSNTNSSSSSGGGGGGGLNSTFRGTGQSLAAIRQAALQAEAQRQAKSMAERLGGGGDNGPRAAALSERLHHHRPGGSGLNNPFGHAEHEASAAAGLVDAVAGRGGSRHHAAGRGGGGGGGTARSGKHMDGQRRHPAGDGDDDHDEDDDDGAGEGEDDEDFLEDLLRDRNIIPPRYPMDAKNQQHQHPHERREGAAGGGGHHRRDSLAIGRGDDGGGGVSDLSRSMESDGSGGWRPRHRRSVDVVDLGGLLAGAGAEGLGETLRGGGGSGSGARSRSLDGSSPAPGPNSRSLVATRKSDDGQLAPPLASHSPRLRGDDDSGSDDSGDGSGSRSSSAHSVADERLVDELEALREELGQKTTLVAGLRGELRKYTDLAMRLEHQLAQLRSHQAQAAAPASAPASDADAAATTTAKASASASAGHAPGPEPGVALDNAGAASPDGGSSGGGGAAAPPSNGGLPPAASPGHGHGPGEGGGMAPPHGLPPHPQAQGLEGPSRLALYREILSQAQLQVGRSGGPAPPDLRDAQELLRGKEGLDAGTEKVMLIKLQKMLTWGVEAGWKASVAAQQGRFLEAAAAQAAAARAAWEAEREGLRAALEEARAAASSSSLSSTSSGSGPASGRVSEGSGAGVTEGELRRQLQAAQDDAAAARGQAEDLECAVASLNADVRKLRVQLRSSRDGSASGGAAERRYSDSGPSTSASSSESGGAPSDAADSRAWALERKLLLSTIKSLKDELEAARAAAAASSPRSRGGSSSGGGDGKEAVVKKVALAEAALERVAQLTAERDAAVDEAAALRRQLDDSAASSTAALAPSSTAGNVESVSADTEGGASSSALDGTATSHHWELERLRRDLAEARAALEARGGGEVAAEAEALRAQVVELRRDLGLTAADLAAAVGWREEDGRALAAEREAGARKDEALAELRQQLLEAEVEREELKAAFSKELEERFTLEEKLRQAREALASALHAAERAHEAMEQQSVAASTDQLAIERDEAETEGDPLDFEEALRLKSGECERLARLVEARSRELVLAESQLEHVREAVSELQEEASETQAQVAELQALLERVQAEREGAEQDAAASRAAADAAEARAGDAAAAALLAKAAAARAIEEAAALRERLGALEEGAEGVDVWRARAEAAEADAAGLRARAAGLAAEARDLRTALSAEDSLQAQLRGQVECLESELEAQASLAQSRGEAAARMEVALAEAGHDRDAEAAAAAAELRAARAAAAEARARGLEAQLAEALRRCERAEEEAGERVRAAEAERDEARRELEGAAAAAADGGDSDDRQQLLQEQLQEQQLAALRAERSQMLADCVALQAGLEAARAAGEAARDEAEGLRRELAAARSELAAAAVELSVKVELMAAKDRSLATLQETVDALKLALTVTQQNLQQQRQQQQQQQPSASTPSPRRSGADAAVEGAPASEGPGGAEEPSGLPERGRDDDDLLRYRGSVAALQTKFADSESTIRRLEQQVAALETRLSADDGLSTTPRPIQALPTTTSEAGKRSPGPQSPELPSTISAAVLAAAAAAAAVDDLGHAASSPPPHRGAATAAGVGGGDSDSTPNPRGESTPRGDTLASSSASLGSLQAQLLQWQSMCEDLHVRYVAKKDTVRRLREQLAAEQARRAEEAAASQAALEAAQQRLGRLAAELGTTLRRCIALDLQPLSATPLTTTTNATSSGSRSSGGSGGIVLPDDINAMAALLARQGAALIESLEAALDQVNTARQERALVTAQLANRQAVLDELRNHLARQAVSSSSALSPSSSAAAAAGLAAGGVGATGPRLSGVSPLAATSVADVLLQTAPTPPTAASTAGGTPPPAASSTHSPSAALAAAAPDTTPHAAPTSSPSPSRSPPPSTSSRHPTSTRSLHAAAISLAQDMAALSAQQAGLRSTLQGFEQRVTARPRSMSAVAAAAAPPPASAAPYAAPAHTALGGGSAGGFPLHSVVSYPVVSPLRARNIAAAPPPEGFAAIPSGSPPHAYVGILSACGRLEPPGGGGRSHHHLFGGAASTGGGLHGGTAGGLRPAGGSYGAGVYGNHLAPSTSSSVEGMGPRALESLRSPTRVPFLGASPSLGGSGVGGGGSLTGPGSSLGLSASLGTAGLGSGLGLSRERRLKLAEGGL